MREKHRSTFCRRCLIGSILVVAMSGGFGSGLRAEETVTIASIYAHSGIAAMQNAPSIRGVRLGVQDLNNRGGVLGKKIELIEIDNRSTPIGSKVAADKAVGRNVSAIIGAAWSSHSIAIAKVAQAQGVPMITSVSTNTKITRIGDFVFRACYSDAFQGRVLARFSREDLNAKSVVIFMDITSDYSMELTREFRGFFEKMGGEIPLELHYKHRKEDFRPLVLLAKKATPDVVFMSGHDESALILKEAAGAGLRAVPVGGDAFGTESFYVKGGNALKRAYYSTHWAEGLEGPFSRNFVKAHKKGSVITAQEALGYDAVFLMADAIERAGSTDRRRIRDALALTRAFQGVSGSISFNENGDPIKGAVIMEIIDGRSHYLKSVYPPSPGGIQ
jgi:branched-chain amino acid transport system substrate-binding protein